MAQDNESIGSSSSASFIFTGPKPPELLLSEDDDVLKPSQRDIEQTYCGSKKTWTHFLNKSMALPRGTWPAALLNPYIAITDVPRLPLKLPRGDQLHGRPIWRIPKREDGPTAPDGELDDTNPNAQP